MKGLELPFSRGDSAGECPNISHGTRLSRTIYLSNKKTHSNERVLLFIKEFLLSQHRNWIFQELS
jgi:hypothetical protein